MPEQDDDQEFLERSEREYLDAIQSGSWGEERKFVLSELHRLDRGIERLRKTAHNTNNAVNLHNLNSIDRLQKLEIKVTKVAFWQTVILAVCAFLAKWLFHV